jgi:putative transposase
MAEPPLERKQPTHGVHARSNAPTIVFVTACSKGRQRWLACEHCHRLLREVWGQARAWFVAQYVIMPDHVHLFAAPGEMDVDLEPWMTYWKSLFSKRLGDPACQWQRSHWDTRMRTGQQYQEKWLYARDNPVRKNLVNCADAWPYQGELYSLRW